MGKQDLDKVGEAIQRKIDRTKKTLKRICCCGCGWTTFGLIGLVVGIILVVVFAGYIPTEDSRRGAGIFGATLIFIGLLVMGIGIAFWVALYIIYRRYQRSKKPAQFTIPTFEYGKAPYPQQPPLTQPGSPQAQPFSPQNGTQQPSAPPSDQKDVHVDIADHQRF